MNDTKTTDAAIAQGKKYGYFAQNCPAKRFGQRSWGRDNIPPITKLQHSQHDFFIQRNTYPKKPPKHHVMGMRANPCAMLVESVSSPITLFMTPLLPFSIPQIQRLIGPLYRNAQPRTRMKLTDLTTRVQKEVERPKQSIEMPTPNKPIMRTGLRPMRSERRLHFNTVNDSVIKKSDS